MLRRMWTVEAGYDVSGNKSSAGNWDRGHLLGILNKNMASFYLWLETLSEMEYKKNGLIRLTKEPSRYYGIQVGIAFVEMPLCCTEATEVLPEGQHSAVVQEEPG